MSQVTCLDLGLSANELNKAITECKTPYVGFFEQDAVYTDSYFELLAGSLQKYSEVNCAKGVLLKRNGERLRLDIFAKGEERIIDTKKDYIRSLIYPCGAIFRLEALRKLGSLFDSGLLYCRDEFFALSFALLSPQYVLRPDLEYKSSRVFDEEGSAIPQSEDYAWYEESADLLLKRLKTIKSASVSNLASVNSDNFLPKRTQYALLYMLIRRFAANDGQNMKPIFGDATLRDSYLNQASEVMKNISNEVLFRHSVALKMQRRSLLYLASLRQTVKDEAFDITVERRVIGNRRRDKYKLGQGYQARLFLKDSPGVPSGERIPAVLFTEQRLSIMSLEHCKDKAGKPALEFIFKFRRSFPEHSFELFIGFKDSFFSHPIKLEPLSMVTNRKSFFGKTAFMYKAYKAVVPLPGGNLPKRLVAYAVVQGKKIKLNIHTSSAWQSRLAENMPLNYWAIPGYLISHDDNCVVVTPASEKDVLLAEQRFQEYLETADGIPKDVLPLRKAYFETKEDYKNKVIWCYYDKSFKAGDNGEHAYRYAMQQDDGIEKVYYINKGCEDFKRLKDDDFNVVHPWSREGRLFALNASVVFMTHIPPFQKLGINGEMLPYFKGLFNAKLIRLYHGFPNNPSPSYSRYADGCTSVVVSSYYERDLYTNEDNMYDLSQIIECGNPRYDELIDDSQRQIVLAPTWRPALTASVKNGKQQSNPNFRKSTYFKIYNQILNDDRLLESARKNNYKIKLFLHPKLSAQTSDFEANDVVEPLSCVGDMDYVTIMRQSDLMVTDYSSVQYDFAYMHKPVVYFHEDRLPYWRIVEFDYENLGFGQVCKSIDQLIEILCCYMENNCKLSSYYRKRIDDFFIFNDHNAGKRLYEAALEL